MKGYSLTEALRASCARELDALQSAIDRADWDGRTRYLIALMHGTDWRDAARSLVS